MGGIDCSGGVDKFELRCGNKWFVVCGKLQRGC